MNKENNYGFIDGQNLYISTHQDNWKVNYKKLFIYLKDKYPITHTFYFFGYYSNKHEKLYQKLTDIGYILIFKKHYSILASNKKGNIDSDIIFEIMKKIIHDKKFNKIVLISGDGDYFKTVNYLICRNKLRKIIFPGKKYSFLYKKLKIEYRDLLINIQNSIKEKRS